MSVDVQYEWIGETLVSDPIQLDRRRVRRHDNAVVWAPAVALLAVLAAALLSARIVGCLGTLADDPELLERATALLSLGLVCALAGTIAARFGRSRSAGWYAGICPLVWLGVFSPRFAIGDPQWLGMVPELLGLYLYTRWPLANAGLCGAAALFALAVFAKDSLVAEPIAVGLDLVLLRDWGRLGIFAGAGMMACGALLAAAVAIDGSVFLDGLHVPAISYPTAQHTVMTYLLLFAPGIVLGGIWCVHQIGAERFRLLALTWMVANAVAIALTFDPSLATSFLFEVLVIDAMVVAVACQTILDRKGHRRCSFLLMLAAIWPVVLLPTAVTDGPHEWDLLPPTTVAVSVDEPTPFGRPSDKLG